MNPDIPNLHDQAPYPGDFMLGLCKKADVSERMALGSHMGQLARYYSRRAIEWCNPEASKEDIDVMLVAFLYGRDLAEEFHSYLEKRRTSES